MVTEQTSYLLQNVFVRRQKGRITVVKVFQCQKEIYSNFVKSFPVPEKNVYKRRKKVSSIGGKDTWNDLKTFPCVRRKDDHCSRLLGHLGKKPMNRASC